MIISLKQDVRKEEIAVVHVGEQVWDRDGDQQRADQNRAIVQPSAQKKTE